MACAVVVAAVALLLPLCVRYITKNVLESGAPDAMPQIYAVGALMLLLTGIHTAGSYIVDYHGHALGARMESDLRSELFAHLQKLSFRFYDERKTGELMSRITNDLLSGRALPPWTGGSGDLRGEVRRGIPDPAEHQLETDPGGVPLSAVYGGLYCVFQRQAASCIEAE